MQDADYSSFIANKRVAIEPSGFSVEHVNSNLFDWQADIVRWALRVGRCGLFEQPGLGKTIQQLSWADEVVRRGGVKRLLLLCPLAIAKQTLREAERFGIQSEVRVCRDSSQVDSGINITNYERIHKFDCSVFDAVVCDESGILKGLGPTRELLTTAFARTRYKLPCTATPAPNDYMELGNHAEFIGTMSRSEMLSMFFVHDGGDTSKWRLRGHAEQAFWRWMCEWSVMIRKPSDLGYSDKGYTLPPLRIHDIVVNAEIDSNALIDLGAKTLSERRTARRDSIEDRVGEAAELANANPNEPWVSWCGLNEESRLLAREIQGAVEVTGSDSPEYKEEMFEAFVSGQLKKLVSKASIFGWGANFQHCCKTSFVGMSDSFEELFQAIRRFYRFGQKKPVDAYLIISSREGAVSDNIRRKERDFEEMLDAMAANMSDITSAAVRGSSRLSTPYSPQKRMELPSWLMA